MKDRLGAVIEKQCNYNIWTDVIGVSRTLLALATLLTLRFNDIYILFKPIAFASEETCVSCLGLFSFSLFCLFPLPVAKGICIAILLLVVMGYRPRYTTLLHVWVTTSFMTTAIVIDGGDQAATVLSILLLPVCLTDKRKWHWTNTHPEEEVSKFKLNNIIAYSAYLMIRLQVFWIYFEACVGKFKNTEWANGTSIYYWLSNPKLGLSPFALSVVMPILANPILITFITWTVLILEGLLALGIIAPFYFRKRLLMFGLVFHILIFLIHGLPTFAMTMGAALILYLWPPTQALGIGAYCTKLVNSAKWSSLPFSKLYFLNKKT